MRKGNSCVGLLIRIGLVIMCLLALLAILAGSCNLYEYRGVICQWWCELGDPPTLDAWCDCLDQCNQWFLETEFTNEE